MEMGTIGATPAAWEPGAREEIRDLVARYNSLSDRGRFEDALQVFAADAVMIEGDGRAYEGHEQILSVFTRAKTLLSAADQRPYVRHMTSTHVIGFDDERTGHGRSYFVVITHVGLDHWGTYVDRYRRDDVWKITRRKVRVDGRSPSSVFASVYDE